ncbi:MAG: LamB/YcsF family protein [Cyclobacteriaceae bacterium]|nr:LamB/YcsF family protein [Cyclobacteriaceae bacterium HetDA_MAG_MS6]
MSIDLNADVGEGFGQYSIGYDEGVLKLVSSCNVACGFHAGDPIHIEKTILTALENGVKIGAHPSYPDLQGFGRRIMNLEQDELRSIILYQISAVKGIIESLGGSLSHVKPHGALYTHSALYPPHAEAIVRAIQLADDQLPLLGLGNTQHEKVAAENQVLFVKEAFADRNYDSKGGLVSRSRTHALIQDPHAVASQVLSICQHREVISEDNSAVPVNAESICFHGDHPNAVDNLKRTRALLAENEIAVKAFSQ